MRQSFQKIILALSLIFCTALALLVNVYLGIDIVYTHLFYIPIILAGIWFNRKAIWVGAFLGIVHIGCDAFLQGSFTRGSILRSLIFLLVAALVVALSWRKDRLFEELKKRESELQQTQQELKRLSLFDSLTGLYNRAYFEQEMDRLSSGRFDPIGVFVCDVDGMKLVNDNLGHDAGDEYISIVAQILRQCFRRSDVIARIGGDEFAILLTGCTLETAEEAYTRIIKSLQDNPDTRFPVSLSVGYAVKTGELRHLDLSRLFKEADNRMYQKKQGNRILYRRAFEEYMERNGTAPNTP